MVSINRNKDVKSMDEVFAQIIERSKNMFVLIITTLFSIYSDLKDVYFILFIAFFVNILAGIVADANVNNNHFNIKKAFDAIKHFGFYVFLVYFIYSLGLCLEYARLMETGVKWTTIIVSYFYLTNITRNMKLMFPKNEAISFIYLLLSTQIFSQLKTYLGIISKSRKSQKQKS